MVGSVVAVSDDAVLDTFHADEALVDDVDYLVVGNNEHLLHQAVVPQVSVYEEVNQLYMLDPRPYPLLLAIGHRYFGVDHPRS